MGERGRGQTGAHQRLQVRGQVSSCEFVVPRTHVGHSRPVVVGRLAAGDSVDGGRPVLGTT